MMDRLRNLTELAETLLERWNSDAEAGKLLEALAGRILSYDDRVTDIRETLAWVDSGDSRWPDRVDTEVSGFLEAASKAGEKLAGSLPGVMRPAFAEIAIAGAKAALLHLAQAKDETSTSDDRSAAAASAQAGGREAGHTPGPPASVEPGEQHAQNRLAELAVMFGVPDGGRYLNDWKAAYARLTKTSGEPRSEAVEALQEAATELIDTYSIPVIVGGVLQPEDHLILKVRGALSALQQPNSKEGEA